MTDYQTYWKSRFGIPDGLPFMVQLAKERELRQKGGSEAVRIQAQREFLRESPRKCAVQKIQKWYHRFYRLKQLRKSQAARVIQKGWRSMVGTVHGCIGELEYVQPHRRVRIKFYMDDGSPIYVGYDVVTLYHRLKKFYGSPSRTIWIDPTIQLPYSEIDTKRIVAGWDKTDPAKPTAHNFENTLKLSHHHRN